MERKGYEGKRGNTAEVKRARCQEGKPFNVIASGGECLVGFTLAEVLITLTIVGVVAAMTIPSLMTKISEKIKNHQIEVFKAKLHKGCSLLNVENGIGPYYNSTMEFVTALSKHLKIVTICDADNLSNCMPYTKLKLKDGTEKNLSDFKTAESLGVYSDDTNDYSSPNVGIVLADGTPMILNYNLKCPVGDPDDVNANVTSCITGIYDINGNRGPNRKTKDIISYNAGWGTPFKPTPISYNECMSIKDKLGISRCCPVDGSTDIDHCYNKDYWAGAVKQCGGVENMPTMEMLASLATSMYRIDNGTSADPRYTNIEIQPYKTYGTQSAFTSNGWTEGANYISVPGLTFNSNSSAAKMIGLSPLFRLWAGREGDAAHAYARGFNTAYTTYSIGYGRRSSIPHGVCLGD